MKLTIRTMTADDLDAAQPLMEQLGYALSGDQIRQRYLAIRAAEGHDLFVGDLGGKIVSLLHVYARPALDKPPEAVVQALVVASETRGGGVGKAMMRQAEGWARQNGFSSVSLASGVAREEAHRFYKALGYDVFATSHLFRKNM